MKPGPPEQRRPAPAWRAARLVAVPLVLLAVSLPFHGALLDPPPLGGAWLGVAAAAGLYLAAHGIRALRLALLATPALHLSLRTVALLHFHTAPVSFAVPFKLGELYRWQQLARLSRDPVGAAVVLVLERTLDAVVLLSVIAAGLLNGELLPPQAALLVALLSAATMLGLFVVLLAPGCLEATQAHMLRHHSSRPALRLLQLTDAARLVTGSANALIRRSGVLLLALSILVWGMESGVLVILADRFEPALRPSLAALPTLTLSAEPGAMLGLTSFYAWLCLATLLLVWPVATALFLRRAFQPSRAQAVGAARLSAQVPRRIRLRLAGPP